MAILDLRAVLAAAVCSVALVSGCNSDRAVSEGLKPGTGADQPAPARPDKAAQPDAVKPAAPAPNPDPKPPAPQPSPKPDKVPEAAKDPPPNADPKPPVPGPVGLVRIDSYLGISSDFKAYATKSDTGDLKVVDLETGKSLPPTWDRDWGFPHSVAFAEDMLAVDSYSAVKIFSRKTGELEQNIHCHEIGGAAFTPDGRFLAITDFRSGQGYYLVIRDIHGKKTIAEVPLGNNGVCSLAVAANRFAAYESNADQITVVKADTGTVVKKFRSGSFRKIMASGSGDRMPLAISPSGKLLACGAEDDIILYDIDGGKIAQRLEGHLDVVAAVAFSPNGETLASTAKDKTLRFWNLKEGKEVSAIKGLPLDAAELIFSADGKKIAVVYRGRVSVPKAEIRGVGKD